MSTTGTSTFTHTNARYIASKVAADLRQMHLFYGRPSETEIDDYVTELVELLVADCVSGVEYGFKRDGEWVVSLRYEVHTDGTVEDAGPGRVYPRADISGASWYSYLRRTSAYFGLSTAERETLQAKIPITRGGAVEPGHVDGYWEGERGYSSGGVGASRRTWRPT